MRRLAERDGRNERNQLGADVLAFYLTKSHPDVPCDVPGDH